MANMSTAKMNQIAKHLYAVKNILDKLEENDDDLSFPDNSDYSAENLLYIAGRIEHIYNNSL